MAKYTVMMHVTGRYEVTVEADSPQQAAGIATIQTENEDFGPLSDIDWTTHHVEDVATGKRFPF